MTPKCSPNDSEIDPMAPKDPYKTLQKTNGKQTRKQNSKKTKNRKPVLASEREARSRLEHCRKNVAQLLYSPDEQAQVQQK